MKSEKSLIITEIIFLAIFILIILQINTNNQLTNFELSINQNMQNIHNNFLIKTSEIIGFIFDVKSLTFLTLIISFLIWKKDSKKDALFLFLTMLLAGSLVYIFKEIIQRARPLNQLITETGFSFPSGHATISIVFFGALIYLLFKRNNSLKIKVYSILISVIIIKIICFSRLYLNLHWLTDILGGLILGLIILIFSILVFRNIKYEKKLI